MTNVVQLVHRVDDQPTLSHHDLLAHALQAHAELAGHNAALAAHVMALTQHVDAQSQQIAELEARSPRPREVPMGWLTPKQAAAASGFSLATIHRWFRIGAIGGERAGVRIFVDPSTMLMRK